VAQEAAPEAVPEVAQEAHPMAVPEAAPTASDQHAGERQM
jgi:hypothetical protein